MSSGAGGDGQPITTRLDGAKTIIIVDNWFIPKYCLTASCCFTSNHKVLENMIIIVDDLSCNYVVI
jgi:hypothetical protein